MTSNRIKEFHDVVVGPGALGMALAAWLARMGPVGLLGRSPPQGPVTVVDAAGFGSTLDLKLSRSPEAVLLQLPPRNTRRALAVWVTLPPENACRVGIDALAAFVRGGERNIVAVFGNNGIVDTDRFRSFVSVLPEGVQVTILRALFFAGFVRDWEDGSVRVTHTGGHRVVLGPLLPDVFPDAKSQAVALTTRASDPRFSAPRCIDNLQSRAADAALFSFEWQDDVQRVESAKFFVNVMLAFGTGPRALPNGTLRERAPAAWLETWAACFSQLFHGASGPVLPADFLATLHGTLAATAANVNSVSLAGHRGDVETARTFVESIRAAHAAAQLARKAQSASYAGNSWSPVDTFITAELERVEREWGLRIPCNR